MADRPRHFLFSAHVPSNQKQHFLYLPLQPSSRPKATDTLIYNTKEKTMFRSKPLSLLLLLLITFPVSSQEPPTIDLTDNNIFQRIWDSDENQFSVSLRTKTGEWENPKADILLDEQVQASGKRTVDLASHPLFYKVNEDKLRDPNRTYVSFIKLLDNYTLRTTDPELTTKEEEAEQQHFLSRILQTPPMKLARNHINQTFGENLSETQFHQVLHRLWFELYTSRGSIPFCSGFEHVFVGEGKYKPTRNDGLDSLGTVSGYHSWIKFYLDEKNQRTNFHGHNYGSKVHGGSQNPNIVTLQMMNTVTNTQNKLIAQLFKRKSGFFVGPSPECEMAMATIVFFESLHGKITHKRQVTINGTTYNLVLYRSADAEGIRGNFIRSFYPVFLKQNAEEASDGQK